MPIPIVESVGEFLWTHEVCIEIILISSHTIAFVAMIKCQFGVKRACILTASLFRSWLTKPSSCWIEYDLLLIRINREHAT